MMNQFDVESVTAALRRINQCWLGGRPDLQVPAFGVSVITHVALLLVFATLTYAVNSENVRAFRSAVVKTALADLCWTAGYLTFRARRFLQRKPDRDPACLLRDFVRNSFLVAGRG